LTEYIKKEKLKILGGWTINLLQKNEQAQVLVSYNLINTFTVPTRVASSSESLIDVVVTNKLFNMNHTETVNMGFSDYLGQICS
jgi:hypothetical protein